VSTPCTNQKYQDPFVAVVIDPNRTISAGKVDIGAFRTYPEGYTPPNASSNYQSIPLSKIEDFGVHADHYYPLEVSVFKSSLDKELLGLLWNKYWVNTLSQSPLISNRAYAVSQLTDLAAKVQKAQSSISSTRSATLASSLGNASGGSGGFKAKDAAQSQSQSESQDAKGGDNEKEKEKDKPASAPTTKKEGKKNAAKEETAMEKAVKDSTRIAAEAQHGLIAQVLKDIIFSMRPRTDNTAAATVSAVTDTVMT
jgi:COP9 signalosome complex subunit 5